MIRSSGMDYRYNFITGKLEFWCIYKEEWMPSVHKSFPAHLGYCNLVEYKDTWCEPYQGMEDD